ncbi:hypothetical protein ACNQFN_22375 [Thauera butanivorans]|uniref:hypothetical protein n=1 Tax=Thauera butanivorans TaxID=86174 RepID=UPI003AB6A003
MGGLLVLALIAGYVWGAAKLFKRVGPYWAKALVVIAAILIPTADAVYGRIKLKQMCEAEGGLHIYRVVEGVEGFDYPSMTPIDEWIKKYGYHFIEGEALGGKRSRIRLQPDGKIVREVGVIPIAKYAYEVDKGDVRDTFLRIESRVVEKGSSEILARYVNIGYSGGWFERFVNGLYAATGNAGSCGPTVYPSELITKTLKPIKQEQTQ